MLAPQIDIFDHNKCSNLEQLRDHIDHLNAKAEEQRGDLLLLKALEESGMGSWDGYAEALDLYCKWEQEAS